MNEILILSAENIRQALPMRDCIAGMMRAYRALSTGNANVPLRTRLELPNGTALFMPAYVAGDFAIKIVNIFPDQKPMISATVLVMDAQTGKTVALLDGEMLTAIRTGAGGGASADLLARPDSRSVAIIGSGVQARAGLAAVCAVRDIKEVRVFSRNRANAEQFASEMAGSGAIPNGVKAVDNVGEAVENADIVYCATTSRVPVFDGRLLKKGAHVIGVGSYTPQMQEVDATTVQNALVVVDSRQSVLAEAGDLLVPIAEGVISADHIYAELGEIIAGTKSGRTTDDQITFFKSVGVAAQDAVAASIALANARALGIGTVAKL
jgi:ornithine cyclodeaminase/alanine dehydrogenase-like protein (mu-crystallin family)